MSIQGANLQHFMFPRLQDASFFALSVAKSPCALYPAGAVQGGCVLTPGGLARRLGMACGSRKPCSMLPGTAFHAARNNVPSWPEQRSILAGTRLCPGGSQPRPPCQPGYGPGAGREACRACANIVPGGGGICQVFFVFLRRKTPKRAAYGLA